MDVRPMRRATGTCAPGGVSPPRKTAGAKPPPICCRFKEIRMPNGRRRFARRRPTAWDAIGPGDAVTLGTPLEATAVLIGTVLDEPLTIVRTRGEVTVEIDAGLATDVAVVGLGIGIMPADAVPAVVGAATSLPGPITRASWDGWFWHSFTQVRAHGSAGDAVSGFGTQVRSVRIDSKAMRKVDTDEEIVVMAELAEVTGAPDAKVVVSGLRLLLKE